MRTPTVAVPLGVLLVIATAAAQTGTNTACDLDCKNSGFCVFIATKNETLKALVQAGQLVQRCECPANFTGIGCEIEKTPCNLETKTCFNGAACQLVDGSSQDYQCDCAIASAVSTRASQMCRRPYTEYCGSEYKPNEPLSFCTNGGKCKSSLLAARLAPGNTTVNAKFEQAGCICPPEFYGPHCEFLHHTKVVMRPIVAPRTAGTITSPTATPTLSGTVTAYPTSASGSMEDLFDAYDTMNAEQQPDTESKARNAKSNLLVTVLLCVLFAIGFVFFASACIIYRHRRQLKQKRHALLSGPRRILRSRHTRTNPPGPDATERHASETETLEPLTVQPIRHQGTANLAPFAIADDDMKECDDDPTDDDRTIWTDEPSVQSKPPVVRKRTTQGGSWIKSIHERMDSLTGGTGPVTKGCGESIGSAYMVDDDETITSHTTTGTDGLPYAGQLTRESMSYLESYRHQTYLVGGDDDIHTINTAALAAAPSWATLSVQSKRG